MLICPITLFPFRTPVLCSDTRLYEKNAINEWLKCSATSPLTRETVDTVCYESPEVTSLVHERNDIIEDIKELMHHETAVLGFIEELRDRFSRSPLRNVDEICIPKVIEVSVEKNDVRLSIVKSIDIMSLYKPQQILSSTVMLETCGLALVTPTLIDLDTFCLFLNDLKKLVVMLRMVHKHVSDSALSLVYAALLSASQFISELEFFQKLSQMQTENLTTVLNEKQIQAIDALQKCSPAYATMYLKVTPKRYAVTGGTISDSVGFHVFTV
tara:strand:- start:566 stop:1375 length:810 start_codon:yes stop_codon:yes gene_type:complete